METSVRVGARPSLSARLRSVGGSAELRDAVGPSRKPGRAASTETDRFMPPDLSVGKADPADAGGPARTGAADQRVSGGACGLGRMEAFADGHGMDGPARSTAQRRINETPASSAKFSDVERTVTRAVNNVVANRRGFRPQQGFTTTKGGVMMTRARRLTGSPKAWFRHRMLAAALIATLGVAGLTAFGASRAAPRPSASSGHQSMTVLENSFLLGNWQSLDPLSRTGLLEPYGDTIYGDLFEEGPGAQQIIPDLATGYKLIDGGTAVEISLRHGVTFTDGTPFDAGVATTHTPAVRPRARSHRYTQSLLGSIWAPHVPFQKPSAPTPFSTVPPSEYHAPPPVLIQTASYGPSATKTGRAVWIFQLTATAGPPIDSSTFTNGRTPAVAVAIGGPVRTIATVAAQKCRSGSFGGIARRHRRRRRVSGAHPGFIYPTGAQRPRVNTVIV